ncbi:MAG: tail fiber domain-containing protein [Micrococcales bacterium]|nr:tail fiber domain-containing protein [Micrococcales bacterium]
MADKKISQLTGATTPLAGTEVLPIVQSGTTVKVANNDLRPKQIQSNATSGVLQVAGPAAATTRVMTTPDANFTAARTDAAQTFSGVQTFSGSITGPTSVTLDDVSWKFFQGDIYAYVTSGLRSVFYGQGVYQEGGYLFAPTANNACSLGDSTHKWTAVWATNGTIQTSDARSKTEIQETPLGLSFIMSLKPRRYKMLESGNLTDGEVEEYKDESGNVLQRIKNGSRKPIPGKRFHDGLVAQELKESLDALQLDAAMWIQASDNSQGLRYEELIAPLIKAIQEQQSQIETLRAEIVVLKGL